MGQHCVRILYCHLFLVLVMGLSVLAADEKGADEPSIDNDTLVVKARLVEIPGQFLSNDAYDYVYLMKYRIVKVLKGTCSDKEILVAHYNPLVPRSLISDKMKGIVTGNVEKFTEGEKHRLELLHPLEEHYDGPVETDYYTTELNTYFAVRADMIK